jgi:hypothetical protein
MVIMAKHPRSWSGANGHLSYQPSPDEGIIPRTLEFVRTQLSAWRDDPKRPPDSSEKRLNSSLCDFLDCRARSDCPMVRFKHEAPQTDARTVDIGVHGAEEITLIGACNYSLYEPFMVIEAKRLPAPTKDREREYVTGTNKASGSATGGIQRFKLGLHGAGGEVAAMVGYIEKHSAQHWHKTINEWITDLASGTSNDGCDWSDDDKLQQLDCGDEQSASMVFSTHQPTDECVTTAIRLCHLWVAMNSGSR